MWLRYQLLCGVYYICLQILLVGMCRQCGSWSVASHNCKNVIGWGPTCASLHDMDQQRPWMMRKIETWLLDSRLGYNRSRQPLLSLHNVMVPTDVMPNRIVRRDASHGGECSKTSAYTGQFEWSSMMWSMLSVATLWCWEGGATLLSTGSHKSCVGFRQPKIRRTELWSWVSMRLV